MRLPGCSPILGRLRGPGAYDGRTQDERHLLNHLQGQQQSLSAMARVLGQLGVNPPWTAG